MSKLTDKELRELDAWIAEHVMGFVWTRHRHAANKFINKRWLLEPEKFKELNEVGKGEWIHASGKEEILIAEYGEETVPAYTTDPAAAMKVFKKCQDMRCLAINKNTITSIGHEDEKAIVECNAETLELAIAKFAKALFSK